MVLRWAMVCGALGNAEHATTEVDREWSICRQPCVHAASSLGGRRLTA